MNGRTFSLLTRAFVTLAGRGYFASHAYTCCQTCAWAEVPDEYADKAVFYHEQDFDSSLEAGHIHLAWSGDAELITGVLTDYGLRVEHDGTANTRIKVFVD